MSMKESWWSIWNQEKLAHYPPCYRFLPLNVIGLVEPTLMRQPLASGRARHGGELLITGVCMISLCEPSFVGCMQCKDVLPIFCATVVFSGSDLLPL